MQVIQLQQQRKTETTSHGRRLLATFCFNHFFLKTKLISVLIGGDFRQTESPL